MCPFEVLGEFLKLPHPIFEHCGTLEDVYEVLCELGVVLTGWGYFVALLMEIYECGEPVMYVF